jgi:Tat protein translocase TatB subunit
MPNVGMGELLLILTIALIVAGPERLPQLAGQARRLFGELRQLASGVTTQLKEELDLEPKRPTLADLNLAELPEGFGDLPLDQVPAGLHISGTMPALPAPAAPPAGPAAEPAGEPAAAPSPSPERPPHGGDHA